MIINALHLRTLFYLFINVINVFIEKSLMILLNTNPLKNRINIHDGFNKYMKKKKQEMNIFKRQTLKLKYFGLTFISIFLRPYGHGDL